MILVFLGSWRSTLIIAVSIPLSILTSVIALSSLRRDHQHHDPGRAGAGGGHPGGRRHRRPSRTSSAIWRKGTPLHAAILDGAAQIAVPALVSTLCICIVFLPMFFLSGVARYLFVPLAEAVVFAMLASYVLSRTLVPTLAMYLLRLKSHARSRSNPFVRSAARLRPRIRPRAHRLCRPAGSAPAPPRGLRPGCFCCSAVSAFLLYPWLGAGFLSHLRHRAVQAAHAGQDRHAHRGDRAASATSSSSPSGGGFRGRSWRASLDNIGLPYSSINTIYSNSAPIGPADADIFVSLSPNHRPTEDYVRAAARRCCRGSFRARRFTSCRPTLSARS